jgi:hypothetical protein
MNVNDPFFLRFKQPVIQNGKYKRCSNDSIRAGKQKECVLGDMLSTYDNGSNQTKRSKELYVENMEMDVRIIENLEEYHIYIRDEHCEIKCPGVSLFLDDFSTPNQIYEELRKKKLIDGGEYRLFQVYNEQIVEEYHNDKKIPNDRNKLFCVEKMGNDEIGDHDGQLIRCVFFSQKTTMMGHIFEYYGEPFLFLFRKGEKLADARVRMMEKLKISKDTFAGSKFAKVRRTEVKTIFSDSDIIADVTFTSQYQFQYYFGIFLKEKSNQLTIKF